jgi:hypothetical protein
MNNQLLQTLLTKQFSYISFQYFINLFQTLLPRNIVTRALFNHLLTMIIRICSCIQRTYVKHFSEPISFCMLLTFRVFRRTQHIVFLLECPPPHPPDALHSRNPFSLLKSHSRCRILCASGYSPQSLGADERRLEAEEAVEAAEGRGGVLHHHHRLGLLLLFLSLALPLLPPVAGEQGARQGHQGGQRAQHRRPDHVVAFHSASLSTIPKYWFKK